MRKHLQLLLLFVAIGISRSWAGPITGDLCSNPIVATLCGNGFFADSTSRYSNDVYNWTYNSKTFSAYGQDIYYKITVPAGTYNPVELSASLTGYFWGTYGSRYGSNNTIYFLWFESSPCSSNPVAVSSYSISGTKNVPDFMSSSYNVKTAQTTYYLVIDFDNFNNSYYPYYYNLQLGFTNNQTRSTKPVCSPGPKPYKGQLQQDGSKCYTNASPYNLPLSVLNDNPLDTNKLFPTNLNQQLSYLPINDDNGYGFDLTIKSTDIVNHIETYKSFNSFNYTYSKSNGQSITYDVAFTVFLKNAGVSGLKGFRIRVAGASGQFNPSYHVKGGYDTSGTWNQSYDPKTRIYTWLFNSKKGSRGDDTGKTGYNCRIYTFDAHYNALGDTIQAWYLPDNYGNDSIQCTDTSKYADCGLQPSLFNGWLPITEGGSGGGGITGHACGSYTQQYGGVLFQPCANPASPDITYDIDGCAIETDFFYHYSSPDFGSGMGSGTGYICGGSPFQMPLWDPIISNGEPAYLTPSALVYIDPNTGVYHPVDASGNILYNEDYNNLSIPDDLPFYPTGNYQFYIPLSVVGNYTVVYTELDTTTLTYFVSDCQPGIFDVEAAANPVVTIDPQFGQTICLGDELTASENGADYYYWSSDFDFEQFYGSGDAVLSPFASSTYTVFGYSAYTTCYDSLTYPVIVNICTPTAFFDYFVYGDCGSDTVSFADESTETTEWNWYFPGGNPSYYYGEFPPYVVYTPGTYYAKLVASNTYGSDSIVNYYPIVVDSCVFDISFDLSDNYPCAGSCININNTSDATADSWIWTFEGGTPSSYSGQDPPTVCYNTPGNYSVQLTATDQFSTKTISEDIRVNDCSIYADFSSYDYQACGTDSIIFYDNSFNAIDWNWYFPGGTPSYYNGQYPPTVTYLPGTYYATLIVSNQYGHSDSITSFFPIVVDTCVLDVSFDLTSTEICNGECISIGNTSGSALDADTQWEWSFPGGSPSSYDGLNPPTVCYNTPGNYTIQLTATNQFASKTISEGITVNDCSLKADFTAFNIICSTDCITVTNNSSPDATNWVWSFPGSDLSGYIGETPLPVCYNQPGNYYIKLVASNAFGADSITKSVEVDDCSPQVMVDLNNIYTDFTTICVHDGIKFGVISSNATNYYWNFPGGDVQNDISNDPPPINFNAVGYYKVTLNAWNNYGYITDTFYVQVDSCNVVASFAVDNSSICNGNCVSITDNTNAPTKQWTFTGGNPSSYSGSNPPDVCYSTPGTYTMELVAVNYGKYDTATQTIVVQNCSPTAAFASPDTICNNGCATISNNSTGNPTSWAWSFEGGNPSTYSGQNPPKVCYADAGNYSISLIVANASGSDTINKQIVVKDCTTPKAVFSANNNICATDCIAFLSLSTGNITSWSWTFTGGTPSTYNGQYPPIVCFNHTGTYRVSLTVANAYGADSTYNDLVVSNCSPKAGFNGPDSTCSGNCINYTNTSSGNSTQWNWQFEGGSPANFTGQYPPPVCYPDGGQYGIRLIASNDYGNDTAYGSIVAFNAAAGNITAYFNGFCEGTSPTLSLLNSLGQLQWQTSDTTFGFTDIKGADGTSYHVPALNHNIYVRVISQIGNCADTSEIYKVNILLPLPINFTWTDTGLSVLFNSIPDSLKDINYSWNFGDGDTSSIPNPAHLFPKDTSYYVCLSAYQVGFENCVYTYCQTLNVGITATTNPVGQGKVHVYPDPFSDYLLIKAEGNAVKSIELYDVLGRRIINSEIGKGQPIDNVIRLDASGLVDGMYYIRIKTDGADYIQNVVRIGK